MERAVGPCLLVIFGASGDLTRRKLVPALYYLASEKLLSDSFAVVGFSRSAGSDEEFRRRLGASLREFVRDPDARVWSWLERRLHYVSGDLEDAQALRRLSAKMEDAERSYATAGNVLFYMATVPELFASVARRCAEAGLAREDRGFRRFVVEKPFGRDLESARELNKSLLSVLSERQIYRIDHYLGKETVQNLLVLRFGNGIFEPIWNRRYIDHVQITVAEELGVERRGGYYDHTGALRDMVPNHIFQLLTLTAMEPPISFEADALRDEQVKALRAFRQLRPEDVLTFAVRGQYGAGEAGGRPLSGYREEPGVPPQSRTETFVAMKVFIDNWRWNDVPFFFRTGKRLPCHSSEIVIQFKRVPQMLFRETGEDRLPANQLVIRIQPNEGIALSFQAKVPGPSLRPGTVDMDFRYQDYFGHKPSTGYERLLCDAMLGDATLFKRSDMLEAGWSFVQPILDVWAALPPRDFPDYPAGSWGPAQAQQLLEAPWRRWRACGR